MVSQIDQKEVEQPCHLKTTLGYQKRHDLKSAVVFLTQGAWDAVIQIYCPLAHFQMSFASLLQEA